MWMCVSMSLLSGQGFVLSSPLQYIATELAGSQSHALLEGQWSPDFFQANNQSPAGPSVWPTQCSLVNRRVQKNIRKTEISGHHCSGPLLANYYIHNFTMLGSQVRENSLSSSLIDVWIFPSAGSTAWNFLHVNVKSFTPFLEIHKSKSQRGPFWWNCAKANRAL